MASHPSAERSSAPTHGLRRALAFGVALSLLVVQFALQTHLVAHDLLPGAHQVCEQCVTAKTATPPPAALGAGLDLVHAAAPAALPTAQTDAHAPLVVRNRAPPSLA